MILLSKLIDWFLPSLREKHGERLLPSHEKALMRWRIVAPRAAR